MKRTGKESLDTIEKWRQLGECVDEDEMLRLMNELGIETDEDELYSYSEGDELPYVCTTCGGPYPQCTSSCKMFDD